MPIIVFKGVPLFLKKFLKSKKFRIVSVKKLMKNLLLVSANNIKCASKICAHSINIETRSCPFTLSHIFFEQNLSVGPLY